MSSSCDCIYSPSPLVQLGGVSPVHKDILIAKMRPGQVGYSGNHYITVMSWYCVYVIGN